MGEKCYGSTTGSNPVSQGSTPCSPANMKRESDGLGSGLQNRVTGFNSLALLRADGGRGVVVCTPVCDPEGAGSIPAGHPKARVAQW